jgi:carbon-monoxide dehydrogenase medium subunit/6-hydroxypseudooxynicotine dehydrogenase subunit alpha
VKPAPFEYADPRSLEEALSLLAEREDAKVLAGGQSLVPLLNFRLARPDLLVDVNGIDELAYLRADDGLLRIGALARQAELEASAEVATRWPLLVQAVRYVGHFQIRNRGTVCGSAAHADAAAELPVALTALEARFHVRSARGARVLDTDEFFVGHFTTALEPDELLVEIEVPQPPPSTRAAFLEFARREGDFALGGAAVLLTGGRERARVALLAAAPRPLRAEAAERALVEGAPAEEAAKLAVEGIEPAGDIHGSGEYRKGLIETLVRRAVVAAEAP